MSKQEATQTAAPAKGPQPVPANGPTVIPALVVVPESLLNEVLGYLAGRPYLEVHGLIQGIQANAKQANVVPLTQEKVQ